MESNSLLAYGAITLFALCWAGALVSWCFGAYYMIKTLRRFRPERRWGQYLPFALFMPLFFTSEGNAYREKLLRALGLFCLFFGGGMAIVLSTELASR